MIIPKGKPCLWRLSFLSSKVSILQESCKRLELGKFIALYLPPSPWEGTTCRQLTVNTNHVYNCYYNLPLSVLCVGDGQRTLTRAHLLQLTYRITVMPTEKFHQPCHWRAGSLAVLLSGKKEIWIQFSIRD